MTSQFHGGNASQISGLAWHPTEDLFYILTKQGSLLSYKLTQQKLHVHFSNIENPTSTLVVPSYSFLENSYSGLFIESWTDARSAALGKNKSSYIMFSKCNENYVLFDLTRETGSFWVPITLLPPTQLMRQQSLAVSSSSRYFIFEFRLKSKDTIGMMLYNETLLEIYALVDSPLSATGSPRMVLLQSFAFPEEDPLRSIELDKKPGPNNIERQFLLQSQFSVSIDFSYLVPLSCNSHKHQPL